MNDYFEELLFPKTKIFNRISFAEKRGGEIEFLSPSDSSRFLPTAIFFLTNVNSFLLFSVRIASFVRIDAVLDRGAAQRTESSNQGGKYQGWKTIGRGN